MSTHDGEIHHDTSEPSVLPIGFVVLSVSVFLIVVFIFSVFLYRAVSTDEMNRKELTPMTFDLKKLRTVEAENLTSLKWFDKGKGLVQIPIDEAMNLVVQDYGKRQK